MLNEIILAVLFVLAGISVLASLCAGAAKIGGIFAGVSKMLINQSITLMDLNWRNLILTQLLAGLPHVLSQS